jgi:hypothetical protein
MPITRSVDYPHTSKAKTSWGDADVSKVTGLSLHKDTVSLALTLPLCQHVILGRLDSPDDSVINLDCFHAHEMGVSRRHASFELCDNCLRLHDLGSRNGTYLNGHRVEPNRGQIVRDGDEIELGRLKMYVYFIVN